MPKKLKPNVIEPMGLEPIEEREFKTFSVKNAAELLDERGLVEASSAAEDLTKWPMTKVEGIAADLFDFLEQQRSGWGEEEVSLMMPFSSLASGSLRGDSGCSRPLCRSAKLGVLGRYAAMYADHVFLPIALSRPSSGADAEELRARLIRTVFSILELRPLVERDLVRPVLPVLHYCPKCARHEFEKYGAGMEAAKLQASKHLGEFEFACRLVSEKPEIMALEMNGPSDYWNTARCSGCIFDDRSGFLAH